MTVTEKINQLSDWIIRNQYGTDSPIVQMLDIVIEQQKEIEQLKDKVMIVTMKQVSNGK